MQTSSRLTDVGRIILMRTFMTGGLMLVGPVIVPYWSSLKVSNTDFVLMKATLLGTILLCELPSGMFADRCGRRMSLIIAGMFLALGEFFYLIAQGLQECLIAEVLIGLGVSLATGTDQAALYEALQREGRMGEFPKIFGKLRTIELMVAAGAAVLSGWCANITPVLPFQICFGCFLVYIAIAFSLKRVFSEALSTSSLEPVPIPRQRALLATTSLMIFAAVVYGSGPVMKTFSQQFFREHVVDVRLFGLAPAIGLLAGALFAGLAGKVSTRWNESILLFAIATIAAGSFALFSFESVAIGMCASALYSGIEVFTTVSLSSMIIKEIGPTVRATVFSIVGLGSRFSGLVLLYQFSVSSGKSLSDAFLACGLLTALVYIALVLLRRYFAVQQTTSN